MFSLCAVLAIGNGCSDGESGQPDGGEAAGPDNAAGSHAMDAPEETADAPRESIRSCLSAADCIEDHEPICASNFACEPCQVSAVQPDPDACRKRNPARPICLANGRCGER